jgi:ABC-2 type transport system permease protein
MAESLRNVRALTAKELRAYFSSPIAWVLMGLFAALFGFFYYAYLTQFVQESMGGQFGQQQPVNINQSMIRGLLGNATVIILFLLPMVTMRSYAEEKRSGTIELLLTSPIKDIEIVLGKFCGAMVMYAGFLAVAALYIGILFVYGNPAWQSVVTGFVGLLLLGGGFIAMGLFISSLTNNQMVAGTATFVVFLLLWIVGWSADSAGPMWGSVLRYLSIIEHFDDFGKGVIDTKHVIFYLSFISLGLFLATKSVDSERWRG